MKRKKNEFLLLFIKLSLMNDRNHSNTSVKSLSFQTKYSFA